VILSDGGPSIIFLAADSTVCREVFVSAKPTMRTLLSFIVLLSFFGKVCAASLWIEGESAKSTTAKEHPWYHGQVKKDLLSGAVSLDGSPLATAPKILLQVMTEEKPSGFETEDAGKGLKRITNLGTDPWLFKEPSGTVRMKGKVKVTALDLNGYPVRELGTSEEIRLDPKTVYYLLER